MGAWTSAFTIGISLALLPPPFGLLRIWCSLWVSQSTFLQPYSPQSEELDAYLRTVRYSSWSFTELVQRAPFQVVVRVKAI